MRTIILKSDGTPSGTELIDLATGEKLEDVARMSFDDIDAYRQKLWEGTLYFLYVQDHPEKPDEKVYIQT